MPPRIIYKFLNTNYMKMNYKRGEMENITDNVTNV